MNEKTEVPKEGDPSLGGFELKALEGKNTTGGRESSNVLMQSSGAGVHSPWGGKEKYQFQGVSFFTKGRVKS